MPISHQSVTNQVPDWFSFQVGFRSTETPKICLAIQVASEVQKLQRFVSSAIQVTSEEWKKPSFVRRLRFGWASEKQKPKGKDSCGGLPKNENPKIKIYSGGLPTNENPKVQVDF
ncbi:hypothetical protein RhiirA5_440677 [Rhizophagus irregularis]|uniref:Uncharacterized protein n=1 Tax=Rhizophagus irregularis TaxID=588596 RepID=A0A2N0NGG0_9GLOM|nr:hypothetical protein RhiirA5_440677 [Rhizophagus irregularis]